MINKSILSLSIFLIVNSSTRLFGYGAEPDRGFNSFKAPFEAEQSTDDPGKTMKPFVVQADTQTIYVDPGLSENCTGNYSIENRDCSGSDGDAYKSLASAAHAAGAGTRVIIREGIYTEQLNPKNSGTEDAYITFKNYGDELVELTGESLAPAILIKERDYIRIEGLYVHGVDRWLNALGANHTVIRGNAFEKAINPSGSSKTGLFFQACNNVSILENRIDNSKQDNIGMVDCDFGLIEGNTITKASHVLWALKCCNYIIVRGNYFHNEIQKIGEIYDCDYVGYGEGRYKKITSLDDSKYNVVENNIFAYTPSSGDNSPYAGIQYAGQKGLIRNNLFYDCVGPPVSLTLYSDEAKFNYSNRISHNVFFDNDFGGIEISEKDYYSFSDQQLKNNIFYKNQFVQNDSRWSWYEELDKNPVQIFTGRASDLLFENNNIFCSEEDELYVIAYGSRFDSNNPSPQSLSWWETNYPEVYRHNLQANPLFVNEENRDFRLRESSPMIDAGTFLTRTSSSETVSTSMKVDDAAWFIDGFGIVPGDSIQLEGQSTSVSIVSIDYATNTLTLDQALSWDAGTGVSMKYHGKAPDLGAFENLTVDSGTGANIPDMNEIKVSPNPTSGLLQMELAHGECLSKTLIYTIEGRELLQADNSPVIDISAFQEGMYFIHAYTGNGIRAIARVVKY